MRASARPGSVWPFFALCAYLGSQAYLIPVRAWGPSWAVWPTLTDFAVAGLLLVNLVCRTTRVPSPANRSVFGLLCIGYMGCVLSYFVVNLTIGAGGRGLAVDDGLYYMLRTTQFLVVYWAAMRTPLTPARRRALAAVVAAVLVFSCILCLVTFAGGLRGPTLVRHLPQGRAAGSWLVYIKDEAQGNGLIGHNHAYVSAQLLLLAALRMSLSPRRRLVGDVAFLLLTLAACFASGSRAGLLAAALFSLMLLVRSPAYVFGALLLAALGMFWGLPERLAQSPFATMLTHQHGLVSPGEVPQFRARVGLWNQWGERFARQPHLLVCGIGFGGARGDAGEEVAHMQYLTVLAEFGVFGLVFFAWLYFRIVDALWHNEPRPSPMTLVTLAFLAGCATQETFYPVVAFGQFLGLYFCAVAVTLEVHRLGESHFRGHRQGGPPVAAAFRSVTSPQNSSR